MTVHDIPDLQWEGENLGSVVFSESFLESSINIQQKGTKTITLRIFRMGCWLIPQKKLDLYTVISRTQAQVTVNTGQKSFGTTETKNSLPWGSYLCFIFHVCHSLALLFMLSFKLACFFSCRWHCVFRQLLHHPDYNCASICLLAGMCAAKNIFYVTVKIRNSFLKTGLEINCMFFKCCLFINFRWNRM